MIGRAWPPTALLSGTSKGRRVVHPGVEPEADSLVSSARARIQTAIPLTTKTRRVVHPGFEPGSKPPEGFRIGHYPNGLAISRRTPSTGAYERVIIWLATVSDMCCGVGQPQGMSPNHEPRVWSEASGVAARAVASPVVGGPVHKVTVLWLSVRCERPTESSTASALAGVSGGHVAVGGARPVNPNSHIAGRPSSRR